MSEQYTLGDVVRLPAAFQHAGEYVDPATVSLTITRPDGSTVAVTWAGGGIIRDSIGHFHRDEPTVGQVAGLWKYVWTTTGSPALTEQSFFTVTGSPLLELVRSIRRKGKDRAVRTFIQDDPLTSAASVITVPAGDTSLVKSAGVWLEADDDTLEIMLSSSSGDPSNDTIPVRRGQEGTPAREHALDTALLLEPRWNSVEIVDAIRQVVELELWPHVWVYGEASLTYSASTDQYAVPVPDLAEIRYAYQLYQGIRSQVSVNLLPSDFANDADYPYGVITARGLYSTEPIRIGYRSKPTLGNLDDDLRSLVALGALAQLMLDEETEHVGPSSGALGGTVQGGAKARSGVILWERFRDARTNLAIDLHSREDANKRQVNRGA